MEVDPAYLTVFSFHSHHHWRHCVLVICRFCYLHGWIKVSGDVSRSRKVCYNPNRIISFEATGSDGTFKLLIKVAF